MNMEELKFRKSKLIEDINLPVMPDIGDVIIVNNGTNDHLAVMNGYHHDDFNDEPYSFISIIVLNMFGDPVELGAIRLDEILNKSNKLIIVEPASEYTIKLIKYFHMREGDQLP